MSNPFAFSSSKMTLIGLGISKSTFFLPSLVTFFIVCLFVPVILHSSFTIAISSTFLSFGSVFFDSKYYNITFSSHTFFDFFQLACQCPVLVVSTCGALSLLSSIKALTSSRSTFLSSLLSISSSRFSYLLKYLLHLSSTSFSILRFFIAFSSQGVQYQCRSERLVSSLYSVLLNLTQERQTCFSQYSHSRTSVLSSVNLTEQTLHVHPSVLDAFPFVEVTEPLRDMVQIPTGLPYCTI